MLLTVSSAGKSSYSNNYALNASRIANNQKVSFQKGTIKFRTSGHMKLPHIHIDWSHIKLKLPHIDLSHIKLPWKKVHDQDIDIPHTGTKIPDTLTTYHPGTKMPDTPPTPYRPPYHHDLLNNSSNSSSFNLTDAAHSLTSFPHDFGQYIYDGLTHIPTVLHHLFGFLK